MLTVSVLGFPTLSFQDWTGSGGSFGTLVRAWREFHLQMFRTEKEHAKARLRNMFKKKQLWHKAVNPCCMLTYANTCIYMRINLRESSCNWMAAKSLRMDIK